MRLNFLLLLAFSILLAQPVSAQTSTPLSIDVAEKSIDITTGFNGAQLIVHGTRRAAGDIAVIIRGPEQDIVVRRKTRVLGLWMNGRGMAFHEVPGFYDLALTRPASQLAPFSELRRYNIGLDALDFETREDDSNIVSGFREAMIRSQQLHRYFPLEPKPVNFIDADFFRVDFALPANVPAGIYRIDAYLIKDGVVVATRNAEIKVAQSGISADIYLFAHNQSLLYAFLAVFMAVFFGWGAHSLLRRE